MSKKLARENYISTDQTKLEHATDIFNYNSDRHDELYISFCGPATTNPDIACID